MAETGQLLKCFWYYLDEFILLNALNTLGFNQLYYEKRVLLNPFPRLQQQRDQFEQNENLYSANTILPLPVKLFSAKYS